MADTRAVQGRESKSLIRITRNTRNIPRPYLTLSRTTHEHRAYYLSHLFTPRKKHKFFLPQRKYEQLGASLHLYRHQVRPLFAAAQYFMFAIQYR